MEVQVCFALSLIALLGVADAQVPHWGACPEPSTQPAFNLKRFMGRWFEVARLPAQFEKGRCIETNFTLTSESSALVQSSEVLKGEVKRIEGTAVVDDQKNPAKLGISFSYVLPYTPYWVLYTDYVSSAVVYSCTDVLRIFHVDLAWVLGRSRRLPESTVLRAKQILMENRIDVSRMIASPQEDCDRAV
ncbi:apolipoprotein Da, duplicate 1 [Clarias gariepinus]|uniref:apolipoprotein Da, duplicate 1 n=1 Tax=Clarias gariepinus TaxID=13013 RepID=UPI00234E0F93|nr:apolipoprotein Da, duplicate 1 [Clarias gariepinus]